MTFFVTSIINYLSKIFLRPSASISLATREASRGVCYINPSGRDAILTSFFLIASFPFLFCLFFFLSLLRDLSAIGLLKSYGLLFLGPRLEFFNPWIHHWLVLDTDFGCWRPTTPEKVLIGVASIGARPDGGLGFGIKGFFDYFFKAIKLLAVLLYFDLHWKAKAFSKVSNHCTFLWGTVWVKFRLRLVTKILYSRHVFPFLRPKNFG